MVIIQTKCQMVPTINTDPLLVNGILIVNDKGHIVDPNGIPYSNNSDQVLNVTYNLHRSTPSECYVGSE